MANQIIYRHPISGETKSIFDTLMLTDFSPDAVCEILTQTQHPFTTDFSFAHRAVAGAFISGDINSLFIELPTAIIHYMDIFHMDTEDKLMVIKHVQGCLLSVFSYQYKSLGQQASDIAYYVTQFMEKGLWKRYFGWMDHNDAKVMWTKIYLNRHNPSDEYIKWRYDIIEKAS